jgi:hypothetical protein
MSIQKAFEGQGTKGMISETVLQRCSSTTRILQQMDVFRNGSGEKGFLYDGHPRDHCGTRVPDEI